jgi:cytochrome-b5 reductase
MKVRGPKGAMVYRPGLVRRFGMIAGGTGITPMLQIIKAIQRGRAAGDNTEVDLIFANVNPEDILLREELDELNMKDKGIRVYYVLNNPPEKWDGGVGFVTAEMIKVCVLVTFGNERHVKANAYDRSTFHHRRSTSRSLSAVHLPWCRL